MAVQVAETPENKFLPSGSVGVIGCPFSGGQSRSGVDDAPTRLVDCGLIEELQGMGWNVTFDGHQQFTHLRPAEGQDPPVGRVKNARYVSNVTRAVSDAVSSHLAAGRVALTLGGDHSLAIGTVAGVMRQFPEACLLWIDAHADINTPESTPSGNLHGCPLSLVAGLVESPPEPLAWVPKCLDLSRLAYIGLRDVDAGERDILRRHNIAAYSMYHVDKYGIGRVVEMALERINPGRRRPVHLSFDVDSLDPSVTPSTGTPVRGGLTWREGMYICEAASETGCLVAVDLMEVNPGLEDADAVDRTVKAGLALVRSAFGQTLI